MITRTEYLENKCWKCGSETWTHDVVDVPTKDLCWECTPMFWGFGTKLCNKGIFDRDVLGINMSLSCSGAVPYCEEPGISITTHCSICGDFKRAWVENWDGDWKSGGVEWPSDWPKAQDCSKEK